MKDARKIIRLMLMLAATMVIIAGLVAAQGNEGQTTGTYSDTGYGQTSAGNSANASEQTLDQVAYIANNEVHSYAPIVVVDRNESNEFQAGTWYAIDNSMLFTDSFMMFTPVKDPFNGLNGMDFVAVGADGSVMGAMNFTVTNVNGQWQLDAVHDGVPIVVIQSMTAGSVPMYYGWSGYEPVILDENMTRDGYAIMFMVKSLNGDAFRNAQSSGGTAQPQGQS